MNGVKLLDSEINAVLNAPCDKAQAFPYRVARRMNN